VGFIHLWLGLASGLVFFIMALTGAVYCFQPEISKLTQSYLAVKKEERSYLPVSQLKEIPARQLPGKKPTRIIYKDRDESVAVHFIRRGKEDYYWSVFLNPYTGEVLKVQDMDKDFFRFMLRGHMYLWLPQKTGKAVISICMILFTVMIISGIVLWWPRNRGARKTSFKVKWNASPKRLNYDLHNVLGFYASWVLVFIVATGLAWSFENVMAAEYWIFSGGKTRPKPPVFKSHENDRVRNRAMIDSVLSSATAAYPGFEHYQLRLPETDSAAYQVMMYHDEAKFTRTDNLYFDQYTGERLKPLNWGLYEDANGGERANRMTYDIHTGSIGGLTTRILVFFAALIAASLPVTGFYIWWAKRKKPKRMPGVVQRS
jgi:uncharacterized iron-regulated membrane protein